MENNPYSSPRNRNTKIKTNSNKRSRGNAKATWKILNRCMSRGTAKRPSTLEDHETLANKFNKYFTSIGELTTYKANLITREYGLDEECGSRGGNIDTGLHVETEAFEFQDEKETEVKSVIKSLAANKAPGYDKISARVLKDSCESIAPVISRLVNNSFKMAAFPKARKIAEMIPVPKEGNSEEPANNRPISLLPILSKVSERLVHKQFVEFSTTHDKQSTYQSGNRKNEFDRNCPQKCYRQHFESSL